MASPRNTNYDRVSDGWRVGSRRDGGRVSEERGGSRRHPNACHSGVPDTEVKHKGADGSRIGVACSIRGRRGFERIQDSDRPGAHSSGGQKNRRNFQPISSELLQDLLKKNPSEAAVELSSLKGSVEAGVNESKIDEKRQRLIWRSLAYICGTICADHTVTMLLTLVSDSILLTRHLPSYLIKLRNLANESINEVQTLFMDVFIVFKTMLQSLPSRVADVKVSFILLEDVVEGFKEAYPDLYKHLRPIMTDMSHQIDALEKEKDRKRQMDSVRKNPPPDDFRQQAILPTARELKAGYQPFLRPHITRGVYADGDHYLDVQFRLLKEDFVYPLRVGISEYLAFKRAHPNQRPRLHDIRMYEEVRFVQSIRNLSRVSYCMSFKTLPRVQWQTSKRLVFGSLVLLSSDDFHTFFFGTVAKREVKELEAGRVVVHLVDLEDASCLLGRTFVMAESSIFFEAYRPVLQGLQRIQSIPLPLARYILSLSQNVYKPLYLRAESDDIPEETAYKEMDISPLFEENRIFKQTIEVTNDDAWPSIDDVKLDPSQLKAVKTALTNELSVIQGPPGTGKTYVGLKIVHILVQNVHLWCTQADPGPILLVCYTNHALDQFLEGILQFLQADIVRVGSRSKSNALQQYNLNRLLRRNNSVFRDHDNAKVIVERTQARLAGARKGIVNEYELGPFMSWKHYNSLLRLSKLKKVDSWMVEWLLCDHQSDSDWKPGQATQVANGEEERVLEEEKMLEKKEEMTEALNNPIDIAEEKDYAEVKCMIEEDFETEMAEFEKDDVPFLGLDCSLLQNRLNLALRSYIVRKLLGKDSIDPASMNKIRDVWRMSPNQRWALYHLWLGRYIADLRTRLPVYENKYKQLCLQLEEARDIEKVKVLRDATIIGMTTTAAASNQQVLQRVRPKIVVVEEAAEVLEAHIITALHSSCQQLILIGDHQQLRPKPNVYMLAKKYHLDISLFERLINNGFPFTQLQLQHRMHPQIADILRKHFYDVLDDHDTVKEFENIKGVSKSMFFIDHRQPEGSFDDNQSHFNLHEAEFLVALCQYLIQQGYKTHEITILTPYTGQLLQFKKLMDRRNEFLGVKVTSIDNYQGEENDIILVSFVRSNDDGKIGFLEISNRLCVSLSRAKKGMFCIGNFALFAENSDLWKGIVEDLKKTNSIGESLQLRCVNHPDPQTDVRAGKDFENAPNGGCMRPCEARLECGHVCRQLCHPTDKDHILYRCEAPCLKTICTSNHTCPNLCSESCPTSCPVIVKKILPCWHSCQAPCGRDIADIRCYKDVEKTLQCNHKRFLPCHESTDDLHLSCDIMVTRLLQCFHRKEEKCCEHGKCMEFVKKILDCGHKCLEECHKHPSEIKCHQEIEQMLPCGHMCTVQCHRDIQSIVCKVVTKKLLSCGHEVEEECCVKSKCQQPVLKKLPCGHNEEVECWQDPKDGCCSSECQKVLPCGHKCRVKCGMSCTEKCEEMITRDNWPCKHKVTVKCCDKPSACYVKCDSTLLCGHSCKGTCGECNRGRFHLPCTEPCQKMLICGHKCTQKCGTPCSSCQQKCPQKCRHDQCSHTCNTPCEVCTKRCNWNCPHFRCSKLCFEPCERPPCDEPCRKKKKKCGHPCIGLCGEICPKTCRVCDKTELEQRFFGTEDPRVSRYMQLEDCGHVFEVNGLDKYIGYRTGKTATSLFKDAVVPSCPRCGTLIKVSRRYGSILHTYRKSLRCVIDESQKEHSELIDIMIRHPLPIESYLFDRAKDLQHMTSNHRKGICFRIKMVSRVQLCSFSFIRKLRGHMKCNEMNDVKIVGILKRALQASADETVSFLTGDVVELTEQQIHDTKTELKRQIMLTEFLELFIKGVKGTSQMEQLVSILVSETRFGKNQHRSVDRLLTEIYHMNGFTRLSSHSLDDLPEQLSNNLDFWRQCQFGHVLRSSESTPNICPACDNERGQSLCKQDEEGDASEEEPSEERGQEQGLGRRQGRGRGRRRGRGWGRGRGKCGEQDRKR
ncbi:NFX1-type zinc finger-containing protein 1-like [Diadema antillarum]|uniref:NFX1-type zinc finger-containing protein 1-like n=1 Tax=Diadema antillarum TaxID=105358 RepID=UPI003A8858F1